MAVATPGASTTAVLVCPGGEAIARRALDLVVSDLAAAIRRRGEAHLALTGGSSAQALYRALRESPRAGRVDWSRAHLWLGDERYVPTADPQSNWGAALREWLARPGELEVPAVRHPVPIDQALHEGRGSAWAAASYAREMARVVPVHHGAPALDVVLLGVGTDGHILSAFPGSPALAPDATSVLVVPAPTHIGPSIERVTLSAAILGSAGLVIVMVPGAAKRQILSHVFGPQRDPLRWPAQLALRPNAVWLVDEACAAGLRETRG